MKKLLYLLLSLSVSLSVLARDEFYLSGRVKESFGKTDLLDAYVLLYDSIGNVRDSIKTNQGSRYKNGEIIDMSSFYFNVPKKDSTFVFDVVCEGYTTQTISYRLDNIGKRETSRRIPIIFMERAPRQLKEVTVVTSKIKFYNKGDTIVYNADAFQLAEGSMLDGLIAQLPGVELDDNGQIKVNGEFVESLLLNGKDFFDGNNNLMLENIAAYTVKNVEVYKGKTTAEKYLGDTSEPKHLTMNVKLKREYNAGWLINAQGGYGTEDRYLGRMFASWFNSTTNVSFVGNFNNLNDSRVPGKNDTWTPEQMPSGKRRYNMAGINYSYENPEETRNASGNVAFRQSRTNSSTSTFRTNFLSDGDTYDYSYSDGYRRETDLDTRHQIYFRNEKIGFGAFARGQYIHHKKSSSNISGAFNSEHQEMTRQLLEVLYSDGSAQLLEDVLNRSANLNDGWLKHLTGTFSSSLNIKLPRSGDRLMISGSINYYDQKEEFWTSQDINYGSDPTPAYRLRHFTDYSPNHRLKADGMIVYNTQISKVQLSLAYYYSYSDSKRDYYMYALERLNDMGVYGVLPDGYLAAFDPSNSYMSRQKEHLHTIVPMLQYYNATDKYLLLINVEPKISFSKRALDYWRDDRDYDISRSNAYVNIANRWGFTISYGFRLREKRPTNKLEYYFGLVPTLPELSDMLEIVDNADPLNVFRGNPALRSELKQSHSFMWWLRPHQKPVNNQLSVYFDFTHNALTRGYTYNTSTGVRNTSVYNVNGNKSCTVSDDFAWQFGSKKQFTLSSSTSVNLASNVDMVGLNLNEPSLQKVNSVNLGERLRLAWQLGSNTLQLRGDFTNRHSSSDREGFNTIDAQHFNYGISGTFKLPKGFGASTDFTCYTRRGYGVDNLDTTDPIWNLRLTYTPPRNSHWTVMVDGFDLLHKLSNVNYAVTATGRTVTYTNTLPRYFLLSVQYRLNIQPKKR